MIRKENSRKRSNKNTADIEEVVKVFPENEIENSTFAFTISKQR